MIQDSRISPIRDECENNEFLYQGDSLDTKRIREGVKSPDIKMKL